MSVASLPILAPVATAEDDDLIHTYCCDPNVALCGLYDPDGHWVDQVDPTDECVVCVDLEDGPCAALDCPDRVAA